MAAFDYIALDAKGKELKGIIEGDGAKQVRQLLRDKGLMPLEITESSKAAQGKQSSGKASSLNKPLFLQRSISSTELALLTRQLATLIQAALPLRKASNWVIYLRICSLKEERPSISLWKARFPA